jgi:hypothetical protein
MPLLAAISLLVAGTAGTLVNAQSGGSDGTDAAAAALAAGELPDAPRVVTWSAGDAVGDPQELAAGDPQLLVPAGAKSVEFVALGGGCRILDTRSGGGAIAAGASRDFSVLNASVPGQGGAAGGCNIPADAVSVDISLSTPSGSPSGVGFLRLGPGGSPPAATVLQYLTGQGTSITTTTALNGSQLRVASFGGSTHVVGDVLGYYRSTLHATVESNGTLIRGSGVDTVEIFNAQTGFYIVTFNRDVSECSPVATPFTSFTNVRTLAALNGPVGEVFVYVLGYNNTTPTAGRFQLSLSC